MPGARKSAVPAVAYTPPVIRSLGMDDYADGSGFVKLMLIAAPDLGKTRWSSAWPRPVFLQSEPLVSIAKRRIEYADGMDAPRAIRIKSSADMLNAAKYLKDQGTKRYSGQLPNYQTVVVDTLDAFSRLVKDEWMEANNAGVFSGHDAWGYLEAKMTALLTRLMNLDAHVIILCHWKDREITPSEGGEKITIFEPNLQGAAKDTVIQDFSLIGWMDYYWEGSGETRHRERGITFESTPQRPFLKNHYGIRPPERQNAPIAGTRLWWPVEINDGTNGEGDEQTFTETNFGAIYGAILDGMEGIPEGATIEQIPDGDLPSGEGAVEPGPGGPVTGAAAAAAKATAAKPAKAAAAKPAAKTATAAKPTEAPATEPAPEAPAETSAPPVVESVSTDEAGAVDPADDPGSGSATAEPAGEAAPVTDVAEGVSGSDPEPTETTPDEGVANAAAALGGEVVSEPAPADDSSEVAGDNACPICNKSLEEESQDLVQLSRLKHRTLVLPDGTKFWDTPGACYEDYQKLNEQKQNKTGFYSPADNPAMATN